MQSATISPNAGLLGSTEPRLFTPPLRELTPDTSYGFRVIWFAREVLGMPLDPWEAWLVIHAGELLEDGVTPRFRKVLVVVARQNGKTWLLVVLTLYWLYIECQALILGTSTKLGYAKESWQKAVLIAQRVDDLADEIIDVRRAAGEEALVAWPPGALEPCRYLIAAANADGGRSLTIRRLVLDELRQHHTWDAYDASYNAMNAVPDGQMWAITNQGDDKSVVLSSLRADAIAKDDDGNEGVIDALDDDGGLLGVFEWSAPPGSRPDDPHALAAANPNLGRRLALRNLLAEARAALREGGERLERFKTEVLCMRSDTLDPAIDGAAWSACCDPGPLDDVRGRLAAFVDVAPDGRHATLAVAGVLDDGRVRVELAGAWDSTADMRRELPGLIERIRPQVLGWLPNGPAAELAADLAERDGWPPHDVKVQAANAETYAICMGFAGLVKGGDIAQSDDELLNDHVTHAERLRSGDRWVFSRRGAGHVDAAYAAAGAVHEARILPAGPGKPRLLGPRREA